MLSINKVASPGGETENYWKALRYIRFKLHFQLLPPTIKREGGAFGIGHHSIAMVPIQVSAAVFYSGQG